MVGNGVAGPVELWDIGDAKGRGVEACFEAVLADARCSEYFTFAVDGDFNCGCAASNAELSIRGCTRSSYYRIHGRKYSRLVPHAASPVIQH